MRVGIVGGSIAGCSAGILLLKEGHDVSIFERSSSNLVGRGGGIGTTSEMIDEIRKAGLIDDDFACFDINQMPFIGKSKDAEPFGKQAWSLSMDFKVFHWNELWTNLRRKLPNSVYHQGVMITHACHLPNGTVQITTSDGDNYTFDLVLFADGYNSLGRKLLYPEKELTYRGYILWRGLLDETAIQDNCELKDEILRLSYKDAPGHNVVYFIPSKDGSTQPGKRIFNWAAYIAIEEEKLDEVMTDQDGNLWEGTLPPGKLSPGVEAELKTRLSKEMPSFYAEVINRTPNSYIQVIYTLDLDQYGKKNVGLIGDAGTVVQPFTGSGVFKGYHNVKDLIAKIRDHSNLTDALMAWDIDQVERGKRLLVLGEQMEKAFIWDAIDFSKATAKFMEQWWKESVTFPEDFNYQRK